ncbi:MAG: copper-binding protein [Betaproteobacteria bacterium]|nr:copper-binding protein [Betaproteobacteria bacterium]
MGQGGMMNDMKAAPANAADMTEGVVRKVDMEGGKITLKHGEIKNLQMPGMTMVFKAENPKLLDGLAAGDKVRFTAENRQGALIVTQIEKAK